MLAAMIAAITGARGMTAMQEARFKVWLSQKMQAGTVDSQISNCRRVERHEGDLDAHYDADDLAGLMNRLNPGQPEHKIPINGSIYSGTATLKNAVRLYRDYRKAGGGTAGSTGAPAKRWPVWPQPNDEDLLDLARAMVPFVRFLDPGIVDEVAKDNRRMGAEWSDRLDALGIDHAIYLWEGSACAFPGVRRHAGSKEIAVFRGQAGSDEPPSQCLALDDNNYPKHLWAFVFTGKPFRKKGPAGYQLAHLFDHKEHGNRWRDELDLPPEMDEPPPLYGLFTSAANSVYVPGAFLRPTDFSLRLRSLVQRRALQLYDDICCIVPPPLAAKPCENPNWALDNFRWSAPVGGMDHVPGFLKFRRERMGELFDKRDATLRAGGTK